jgi:hypothetical protein
MINGVSVNNPSLKNVLDRVEDRIFQSMNCVKIGSIVSFDKVKRTAVVQIHFKRSLSNPMPDGTSVVNYPQLFDCPVFTLQGGGAQLTMPIKAGDECIVLFADNNIDAWYENGKSPALPYYDRRHDLSDGIAIVGLNSLTNALIPAVTADEAALTYGGAKVAQKNGKITVQNATTNLITITDTLLTAMNTYQTAMGVFLTAVSSSSVLDTPTKTAASTMIAANTAFQTAAGVYKTAIDALLY